MLQVGATGIEREIEEEQDVLDSAPLLVAELII
jgi:hypothetical protein